MSKHSFTILFIIISTIFNIILTFGLIILLIVGVSFLLFKLGGLNPQSSIGLIAVVVCFLGGLIGGMVIFTNNHTLYVTPDEQLVEKLKK